MALNAYLRLKTKKNEIRGSESIKGHEGDIAVHAIRHGISRISRTSRGFHRPLVITKELDKSSPLLYEVLDRKEVLTECKLQQYRIDKISPVAKLVYTISLRKAMIDGIDYVMPNNCIPELSKAAEYEQVSFTYEQIEWSWLDGDITSAASLTEFEDFVRFKKRHVSPPTDTAFEAWALRALE
jgi:type VI secretion system secreted protein Hcp